MQAVAAHYSRPGLQSRIDETLRSIGRDPARLNPDELAPLDQFHTGGKAATLSIARAAGIHAGQKVLDVGGGLGGPARVLAQQLGCTVTVLDLTEEFCQVGRELTLRCGLADKVEFVHGNALKIPFDDGSFDVVWSQHSSMNIPEKPVFYAEIARVLKPGGKYVLHDIFSGPTEPVLYPAPWASRPDISFVVAAEDSRAMLKSAGLREISWKDTTEPETAWLQERLKAPQAKDGPFLGIHLILGDVFKPAFGNMLRNLQEGRTRVVEAVFVR